MAEKKAAQKQLQVTLIKSPYGRTQGHKETVLGLGLRNRHDTRILIDTPAVRGMIHKVAYLVKCEEI